MKKKSAVAAAIIIAVIAAVFVFAAASDIRYEHKVKSIYESISKIRYAKAYLTAESAVSLKPYRPEAYIAYSELKKAQGDMDQSCEILKNALDKLLDKYEDKEKKSYEEAISQLALKLSQNYYDYNRTEMAVSLIEGLPENIRNYDEIDALYVQITKEKIIVTESRIVEWKDKAFEGMIRQMLGKSENEDIKTDELCDIRRIDIWGNTVCTEDMTVTGYTKDGYAIDGEEKSDRGQIAVLDDIENFPNLEYLSVNYQENLSLAYFQEKEWKRIRTLSFISDNISDITPLMWATGISTLYLDYNNISDFLWISRIGTLNVISARGNTRFYSGELLGGLEGLRYLDVSKTEDVSAERIAEIPNLEVLITDGVDDITQLADCPSLKSLNITIDETGILYIRQIKTLESLYITMPYAADLSELSMLGYLKELYINSVTEQKIDIKVIENITNLEVLGLFNGEYESMKTIAKCKKLGSVLLTAGDDTTYRQVRQYFAGDIRMRY